MDLGTWLKLKGRGERSRIRRDANVHYDTIKAAVAKRLKRAGANDPARRISAATGGNVRPGEMLDIDLETLES
jgi:hypothetical protein